MKLIPEKILRFLDRRHVPPPGAYYIELTNVCNFRCSMCNFHSSLVIPPKPRVKGFMDITLAKKIINQIAAIGRDAEVSFHGAGESLLHNGLIEILKYSRRHKNIHSGFLTNAMLLDEKVSNELLDTGISWIGFSLDGVVKEKFEKYRVGSDYDKIMRNVGGFLELKNRRGASMTTKVNMTMQDEMKGDVDRFIDFWIDKVDEVCVSPFRPVGSRHNVLAIGSDRRLPCYMLYEMMVIFQDGKVALCCEDWFNEGAMGDTAEESLTQIWEGRKFSRSRRLHEKGSFDEIRLCRECNSWYNTLPQEYKDEKRGYTVRKNAWQCMYSRK